MTVRTRRVAALVALPLLAATGCRATAQTRQEVVVEFAAAATPAQHDAVRAACSGLPGVVTEPKPTDALAADRRYDLRYDVTRSTLPQRAALYDCLRRHPQVVGVSEPQLQ